MAARMNLINLTSDVETMIDKAIDNLQFDRSLSEIFVQEISQFIQEATDPQEKENRLKFLGPVAAKFIEAMQRSNEQLLKLASLQHKRVQPMPDIDDELDIDEPDIFDILAAEKEVTVRGKK